MEALRGGGCVPPGVLSFLAVASPVLLLVALHPHVTLNSSPGVAGQHLVKNRAELLSSDLGKETPAPLPSSPHLHILAATAAPSTPMN